MSIGERIYQARKLRAMSLRVLGNKAGVSHSAIQKYEKNEDVPSSDVLVRLSRALDVRIEFFFRDEGKPIKLIPSLPHKKLSKMPKKAQESLRMEIKSWLENFFEIEDIVGDKVVFDVSKLNVEVKRIEDVEKISMNLRREWELGVNPIKSVIALLEDKGVKITKIKKMIGFDSYTFWAEYDFKVPVIALKEGIPITKERFELLRSFGQLILKISADLNEEEVLNRFARAFLVPASNMVKEFGEKRNNISWEELKILKQKYGISMKEQITRAQELSIISENYCRLFLKKMNKYGYSKKEPLDLVSDEKPQRLNFLVSKAFSQGMISSLKASELLNITLEEFSKELMNDRALTVV